MQAQFVPPFLPRYVYGISWCHIFTLDQHHMLDSLAFDKLTSTLQKKFSLD